MKLFPRHQNQKIFTHTVALAILVLTFNVFVFVLAGIFSNASYQSSLKKARTDARNLAHVLKQDIDGLLEKVDTVLYSTSWLIEKQLKTGKVNKEFINEYMAKQSERIPRADSLRATNAKGTVLYGTNVPVNWTRNLSKRQYFQTLKNDPKVGFIISDPVTGGISGKRVMVFARRINMPDGSFGGIVYAPVTVKTFAKEFASIQIGDEGNITLRKGFGDLAVLVRQPEIIYGTNVNSLGSTGRSSEYADVVSKGDKSRVYETASGVDGVFRTFAVLQLDKVNYYVCVGLAHNEVLAAWKKETIKLFVIATLFMIASIIVAIRFRAYINAKKTHQQELEKVAHYDPLTGLPNRRLLSDRIEQSIARSTRKKTNLAVCMVDLDDFKLVNDQFGHEAGDRALVALTAQIKDALRADDTLARIGGDEFVLLLELEKLNEIHTVLDRVLSSISLPINVQGITFNFSASIGVAFHHNDANPDILMRYADQAMYLAKRTGKNSYRLFEPSRDQQIQSLVQQNKRMNEALENNEFLLHYQPKVDMVSGIVMGAEALIRWQHPKKGLLYPDSFLPQISESKLEVAIGNWVIESALAQKAEWDLAGVALSISINISAAHLLHADFIYNLQHAFSLFPTVSPEHIEFEILETAAISDMEQATLVLNNCKALGIKISLDDFGTGYSSLTYLRNLPVDTLKIDRSFVRDMLSDPADLDIVVSIINLAKTFNRGVIAEGVETLEQGEKLIHVGCHHMQGFGISKPMPAEKFQDWIVQWQNSGIWKMVKD